MQIAFCPIIQARPAMMDDPEPGMAVNGLGGYVRTCAWRIDNQADETMRCHERLGGMFNLLSREAA